MCGKTLKSARWMRGTTGLALIVATGLIVGGCSAANLTDFEFPVFGLLKKSDQEAEDPATTASIPRSSQRLGVQ